MFNEIEYKVQDLINDPCLVSTTGKNPVHFARTIIGICDYGEDIIFTVRDCGRDISHVKIEFISLDMKSNIGKRRRTKTNFYSKNNDIIIPNNTTGRQKKRKTETLAKKAHDIGNEVEVKKIMNNEFKKQTIMLVNFLTILVKRALKTPRMKFLEWLIIQMTNQKNLFIMNLLTM